MFGQVTEAARRRGGIPIFAAFFWSGVVGLVAVVIACGTVRQIESAYWPTAPGTITVSEPAGQRGHSWELEYAYSVAGLQYNGTKYAYDPMPIQGNEEVLRHIAVYPVGAEVTVHYDPDNPAEAVLRPGLRGCTLWIALFLTPFILIGVGMWLGLLQRAYPRPGFNVNDPRQVATTETGAIVVRPKRTERLATFLTYLGYTTFLVSWLLAFVGAGLGAAYWIFEGFLLDPPIAVPASVWAAVVLGCVLLTWLSLRRTPVLTLDGISAVLRFGPLAGAATEVPFARIKEVAVSEHTRPQGKGSVIYYAVQIDHGRSTLTVAEYDNQGDAEALAGWLRKQLELTSCEATR
jgi:hypothetical protein